MADVLLLGYVGAMPAEGLYLLIARIATAYYFLHFLVVLPVVGLLEKTDPIPLSISEPVLSGGAKLSMAKKDNEKFYFEKTTSLIFYFFFNYKSLFWIRAN